MSYPLKKYRMLAGFCAGIAVMSSFSFYQRNGGRDCVVSCDLMSTVYIGLYNYMVILTRNIPEDSLKITAEGGDAVLTRDVGNYYILRTSSPGTVQITVADGSSWKKSFQFISQPMPDPIPLLGARYTSSAIDAETFKSRTGIAAPINCCGVDARCEMVSYWARRVSKKDKGTPLKNTGAWFEPPVQQLVDKAVAGDQYFFTEIKARCPGDKVPRDLGTLSFRIK